jgi:hypothetical protein
MDLKEKAFKDMDFICLAQATAQWRTLNDKKKDSSFSIIGGMMYNCQFSKKISAP